MKKIGWYLTILFLSLISFWITNKTINYLKQKDELMLFLKQWKDDYYQEPIKAVIKDNTIIPGLNGYKVNIDKSYTKLKNVGSFHEQLLIYDQIKVKDTIKDHLDKYIIAGNKKKNMVSILLFSNELIDVEVPLNYIVSYNDLDNLSKVIKEKDNILISNINKDNIKDASKIIAKHNNLYCFNEDKDAYFKDLCFNNSYYSISTSVITSNYLNNVKKCLKGGSLIVLKGNYQKELNLIINYIYAKGFIITNLDTHLKENI